jgi:sec-independent protein translocase protein TatC
MSILKWPLSRAEASWPGTNQVVSVNFGTNHLTNLPLTTEQQRALHTGTNRFASITVEPLTVGTNQILGWRVDNDPAAIANLQRMHIELINLTPAGGFFVAFQVALYGGMVLAAPFMLFFIAQFVFPALKINERKYIYRAIFIGGGLFFVGVAFCYFVLMPFALAASQMYSNWLGLGAMQWRAEEYISFVCRFMLGMGLGFEMPVILLTLVKLGVLDYQKLRSLWRYMIVINLVLGAVLTTPEVLTQILMAAPLYLLYEVSVWIAWYWERPSAAKRRARWLLIGVTLALAALVWWLCQYGRSFLQHFSR